MGFVHLQQQVGGGMGQMGGGGGYGGAGGEGRSGSGSVGGLGETLDPGLRGMGTGAGNGGGNGTVDSEEERGYREREESFNQGLRLNAEQALLAHAAAPGSHASVVAEAAAANR